VGREAATSVDGTSAGAADGGVRLANFPAGSLWGRSATCGSAGGVRVGGAAALGTARARCTGGAGNGSAAVRTGGGAGTGASVVGGRTGAAGAGGTGTCVADGCATCGGGGAFVGVAARVGSGGVGTVADAAVGTAETAGGAAADTGSNTMATCVVPGISGSAMRLGRSSTNASRQAACASSDSMIGAAGAAAARACENRCRSTVIRPMPDGSLARRGRKLMPCTRPAWAARQSRTITRPAFMAVR